MDNLDSFVKNYNYRGSVMEYATDYCADIFLRRMKKGSVLELGPAEGIMTERLLPHFPDYTVVDGSEVFVNLLKEKFPQVNVVHSFFEDFKPESKFDNIVLGHVLEHVDDPVKILKLCSEWLSGCVVVGGGGQLFCAVPNSHSIHRQAAVKMGLLKCENQLNNTDRGIGHKRVYNLSRLKKDFLDAGLEIVCSGGYWLKPLSNQQIEQTWDENMINAFMRLGEDYPDIAGEIYVVARKK